MSNTPILPYSVILSQASDKSIKDLKAAIAVEEKRREELAAAEARRKQDQEKQRVAWIKEQYDAFESDRQRGLMEAIFLGEVTVVYGVIGYWSVRVGSATSRPMHCDKYDRTTGIAVAYAKLKKQPIPYFI